MNSDPPQLSDEGGEAPCFAHLLDDAPGRLDDTVLAQLVRDFADAVVIADPDGTIVFWKRRPRRASSGGPLMTRLEGRST